MSSAMQYSDDYLYKQIIVVGAGISGLACASHLIDYGFQNVLLIEAKNHIGGRTYTVNFEREQHICDGSPGYHFIEFGAQWIHGQEGNVINEIAHSKGLLNETAPNYFDALTNFNILFTEDENIAISNLMAYLDGKLVDIPGDFDEDLSVADFLDKQFQEYVSQYDNKSQIPFLKRAYDWYCKISCELDGCESLSTVSACFINQYQTCEGSQNVELKYGFRSVLNLFYEKIPSRSVLKNCIVQKIDWSDFKISKSDNKNMKCLNCRLSENNLKIKVSCDNGRIYTADHVVVTIPLGFLKKHVDTLFNPVLSEKKVKAIHALGFGTLNKIFLEFSKPFWEPPDLFHILWDESFDELFYEYRHISNEDPLNWVRDINRFSYTPGHPNMLCAWIAGKGTVVMEKLSEDEISCCCMKLLEKVLQKKLPLPSRILRSAWNSDPCTYGSYSYISINSWKGIHLDIIEPEYSEVFCSQHPVLQFAGEATNPIHFSTVHGAYETGLREAQRLFKHYRNIILFEQNCVKETFHLSQNLSFQKHICNNINIIIIGAGIAGLAAAHSLFKKGFTQVKILEAQERIGGRILSKHLNNNCLELGAQWIHGRDNPLYDFSLSHNLLSDPSDEPSYEGKGVFFTCSGEIIEKCIIEEVKNILEGIRIQLNEGQYSYCFSSKSALKFFSDSFDSYLATCNNESLNACRKGIFDWFIKYEIIDNACDDLDDVALGCYTDWCDVSSDTYYINFTNSFSSLIDIICSQLPTDCITLKKPVKTINWQAKFRYLQPTKNIFKNRSSELFPVSVECEDGEYMKADIIILTASVGFVKENMDSFFSPVLPDKKATAFANIGFGTINKIYLIFEKPFWDEHILGFQLIWTNFMDMECRKLLKENPWVKGVTGFDIVRKQHNVLLGWVGGTEAKMLENVEPEAIGLVCINLLKKFLNRADIPYPIKTVRSCWYNNQYVRGAYSYRSMKFCESRSTLDDLQSPLYLTCITKTGKTLQWPAVIFAGEAMDETSFSTVHGAFQSGLKAAACASSFCLKIEDLMDEN